MSFSNLPAQNQSNPGPARLGGKEGNEQVRRIGQAWTFIDHPYIEVRAFPRPAHLNRAAGFQRRIRRIADQVDQQLLQLVGVGRYDRVRPFRDVDLHACLKFHRSAYPFRYVYRQQLRLWQPCQLRVRRHEPPGKASSMVCAASPSRHAPSPSSSAVNPSRRSSGRPSRRSPARLTSRSFPVLSKVKTARSISSITVRRRALASNAPKRCCRSTSPRAFTSIMTSPMASSLRAPRARNEKSSSRRAARRFESVCREKTTRCRSEKAKPSQREKIKKASVQTAPEE